MPLPPPPRQKRIERPGTDQRCWNPQHLESFFLKRGAAAPLRTPGTFTLTHAAPSLESSLFHLSSALRVSGRPPMTTPSADLLTIHTVRGTKVVLDGDLARLYGAPTFRLNEALVA